MISLKPLNADSERDIKPFAVCDIETSQWVNFLCIGTFDANGAFHHFTDIVECFRYLAGLAKQEGRKSYDVFAHFGGGFDFLFLIRAAVEAKLPLESIIPRGSSLLCFDLNVDGVKLTFRDSAALLPFSLRKLAEQFGVDHQKLDIDYEKITEVTPELLKYLKHDCIALYEILIAYFNSPIIRKAGPAFTIASQAIRVLRTYIDEPIPSCPQEVERFVRKGYFGGRVEVLRTIFEGPGKLHCYDINSLYPTVMRDLDAPTHFLGWSYGYAGNPGFYECTVEVPKNHWLPCLPKVWNGKLVFPVGTFSGVWSHLEIEYAKSLGCRVLSVRRGAVFQSGGFIFRDFITDLYRIRNENPNGSVLNTQAKLLMNSAYGRMGINRERENVVFDEGQEGFTPQWEIESSHGTISVGTVPVVMNTTFSNVAVAAYVTAAARIYHHKLMRELGQDLYYTDTDSIFTTKEIPSSRELGAYKHEYSVDRACFLLPKTYLAECPDLKKVVAKGFDKKKTESFTFEDFKNFLEGEIKCLKVTEAPRFARFKTALRKGKFVAMTDGNEKRILSKYDKRRPSKTDRTITRPIILKKGK